MWYVLQVRTGCEDNICLKCKRQITDSEILERCFVPRREKHRRLHGRSEIVTEILFPGYVFVITQKVDELFTELKKIQDLTKLLGADGEFIPLTEKEVEFLQRIGGEEQLVKLSEGIIEGGQIKVIDGPLIGYEGMIRKIDRHKRKAWVEVEMFGGPQLVEIGLEVVEKR